MIEFSLTEVDDSALFDPTNMKVDQSGTISIFTDDLINYKNQALQFRITATSVNSNGPRSADDFFTITFVDMCDVATITAPTISQDVTDIDIWNVVSIGFTEATSIYPDCPFEYAVLVDGIEHNSATIEIDVEN